MAESGGLTAKMATLAVFARGPNTLAGVTVELAAWPGAQWDRNAAHKHVPKLAREGQIRRMSSGKVRSLDCYEITSAGEAYRREWLFSRAGGMAAIERDTALGKLALCRGLDDLTAVIESIQAEERLYEQAYGEAHARSITARRARLRSPDRPLGARERRDEILVAAEAAFWDDMVKRLLRLRKELETLRGELVGVSG